MELNYTIGKNAEHNTELCDTAAPDDIWFHAGNTSSAHLILRNPEALSLKQLVQAGTIYRMAVALRQHHQKFKGLDPIPITYCQCRYIKTTRIPGAVNVLGPSYSILV